MRKQILISIAMLPLLLTFSHAAQRWSADLAVAALGVFQR